jgi:hypothetical protein
MTKNTIIHTLVILVCLGCFTHLLAATPGDQLPKARAGKVEVAAYDGGTVSADGGSTPTLIATGLIGRNALAIYNNGPATIWCGWTSTVTPLTGFPVASGSSLSVDVVYLSSTSSPLLYCVASNGRDQEAPANTRWIQVK